MLKRVIVEALKCFLGGVENVGAGIKKGRKIIRPYIFTLLPYYIISLLPLF